MPRILRILIVGVALCATSASAVALDRNAFTFTRYDLAARIVPGEEAFAVEGRVTLRNDSPVAQSALAMQISSTLAWKSIRLSSKALLYVSQPYTTDIDHTGAVTEAVVTLPAPVAPKASIELEIAYSGTIPADTGRLTRIGIPSDVASRTDWDQINANSTAVRGVGYVCWYPVSINAVSLSDGNAVFQALAEWRERHANSALHLQLSVLSDQLVLTNGHLLGQKAQAEAEGTLHQREYEWAPMGVVPPTFAMGDYTLLSRPSINVFYLAGHQPAAQEYALAAEKDAPLLADWFGPQRQKIVAIDLPASDVPFDSGAILFSPLGVPDRNSVEVAIAHQIAHASFEAPRLWISEGLAQFAQALVREHQDGRKAALAYMQKFRPALAQVEQQNTAAKNAHPAQAAENSLIRSSDEIYYRVKAMFAWWMLRDMVGDQALQRALHSYRAARDQQPAYVQQLVEAQAKRSLEWFFDDWIYRDRGLPDFRITAVYPRQMLPQNVYVTVTVENSSAVRAEVPVIVPVPPGEAVQRVLAPAHGEVVAHIQTPSIPAQVMVNDGSVPESDVTNNTFTVTEKP